VELGHQDVEQDQVEGLPAQQLERLAAVLGEDDPVAFVLETAGEQEPVDPVVVRDEDGAAHEGDPARSAERACSSGRYSASICSTSFSAPSSSPAFARCSRVRQSSANSSAPNVAPFDFSVCAARRSSSLPCSSSERRSVA